MSGYLIQDSILALAGAQETGVVYSVYGITTCCPWTEVRRRRPYELLAESVSLRCVGSWGRVRCVWYHYTSATERERETRERGHWRLKSTLGTLSLVHRTLRPRTACLVLPQVAHGERGEEARTWTQRDALYTLSLVHMEPRPSTACLVSPHGRHGESTRGEDMVVLLSVCHMRTQSLLPSQRPLRHVPLLPHECSPSPSSTFCLTFHPHSHHHLPTFRTLCLATLIVQKHFFFHAPVGSHHHHAFHTGPRRSDRKYYAPTSTEHC